MVILASATPGRAQKVDNRPRSRVVGSSVSWSETFRLSADRWSIGWRADYRQGRSFGQSFSSQISPTSTTKITVHGAVGPRRAWEAKLHQRVDRLLIDVGAGSGELLHAGLRFGARKGKGLGASVSWVRRQRRQQTTFAAWHRIASIGVRAAVEHGRRGLRWSVTKERLGPGALRFDTGSLAEGGGHQELVYGIGLRGDGVFDADGFDGRLDLRAEPDIFDSGALEIDSPLHDDERPLAWLVDDFGGRLTSLDRVGAERKLEAETVKYLSDSLWVGGEYSRSNGRTDGLDAKFGSTREHLQLAATVGYDPRNTAFQGSFELRWRPGHGER